MYMKRPSDKLLKDKSNEELSMESEWHAGEASKLFDEVTKLRTIALESDEQESDEILQSASDLESEAQAHIHQSNLLASVMASRLSEEGVGTAEHAARA